MWNCASEKSTDSALSTGSKEKRPPSIGGRRTPTGSGSGRLDSGLPVVQPRASSAGSVKDSTSPPVSSVVPPPGTAFYRCRLCGYQDSRHDKTKYHVVREHLHLGHCQYSVYTPCPDERNHRNLAITLPTANRFSELFHSAVTLQQSCH